MFIAYAQLNNTTAADLIPENREKYQTVKGGNLIDMRRSAEHAGGASTLFEEIYIQRLPSFLHRLTLIKSHVSFHPANKVKPVSFY